MQNYTQEALFSLPTTLPNGLVYRPEFITESEEEVLLAYLNNVPLKHALYKGEYKAKRRHAGFGWGWNYRSQTFMRGEPLPRFLQPTVRKIAKWIQVPPARVAEALINEYSPGAAIGWHVDNEGFEKIIGVSLGAPCTMQWRPLAQKGARDPKKIIALTLEPRSAYIMQNEIRWQWQHHVPPVEQMRFSITFRTLPANVHI